MIHVYREIISRTATAAQQQHRSPFTFLTNFYLYQEADPHREEMPCTEDVEKKDNIKQRLLSARA